MKTSFSVNDPLKEEQLKLQKYILNTMPVGYILINRQGTIVQTSKVAREKFGYYWPEDLEGKCIDMLLHEPDREGHLGFISGWFDSPNSRAMRGREFNARMKDGSDINVMIALRPYYKEMQMSFEISDGSTDNQYGIAYIVFMEEFTNK